MIFHDMTREQLIEKIEELTILNRQLLDEKEQEIGLDFSWTGNLGHWYWNIKTNTVTFNPLKITTLGYSKEEIPEKVSYQFFTEKLHPEDYQKAMDAMLAHLYGKSNVYEIEYRIRAKDGSYRWYYDRGKITQYNADGKPVFLAGIVFDITEKKEMQRDLEIKNMILSELSSTDGLTKIKNHRALIEYLKNFTVDVKYSNKYLSITIFDIDDFKKVNDHHGHIYGDKVLADVAAIIKSCIREEDIAGRYGGEEFMIILPNTELSNAILISERIRNTVEQYCFGEDIQVTISGGVKVYNGETLSEFIQGADTNLYEAKRQGKNRIIY
ncbi:MAG: GGDEF domain-containing protein [Eubacteriales bacterium]